MKSNRILFICLLCLMILLLIGRSSNINEVPQKEDSFIIKLGNLQSNFPIKKRQENDFLKYVDNSVYKYYINDIKLTDEGDYIDVNIDYTITTGQMKELDNYVYETYKEVSSESSLVKRLIMYTNKILKDCKYSDNQDIVPYSPYSVINSKKANCQGLTLMFKKFLDYEDVPNWISEGDLNGVPHMWNLIQLNDDYYHIDITHIMTHRKDSEETLLYFLLSDIELIDRTYNNVTGLRAKSLNYSNLNKFYETQEVYKKDAIRLPSEITAETLSKLLNIQVVDYLIYKDVLVVYNGEALKYYKINETLK